MEMNEDELFKGMYPWFDLERGRCLEMVDPMDIPKFEPKEDEWGFPTVRIFYQNEELSSSDISEILEKRSITLAEGAHLLLGLRASEFSIKVLTKPFKFIYEKAITQIRQGHLKALELDESKGWKNSYFEEKLIIKQKNIIIQIEDSRHGQMHSFKPVDFLDWALDENLITSPVLLKTIGMTPLVKSDEWSGFGEMSYPLMYLKENLLHQTVSQFNDVTVMGLAQLIWEYENHNISISDMEKENVFSDLIPNGQFKKKDAFRNKVKHVDPRPKRCKVKNSTNKDLGGPYLPKLVPGISQSDSNGRNILNFLLFRQLFRVISKGLKWSPSLGPNL